jgi:hypothetical protein
MEVMTYESRLHNMQARPASMIADNVRSWNEGYKHARHEAATIGCQADAEIARLREELADMTADRDAAYAKGLEDAAGARGLWLQFNSEGEPIGYCTVEPHDPGGMDFYIRRDAIRAMKEGKT